MKELESCEICPHQCKVNRTKGQVGRCKCDDKIKIALVSIHEFEEPCISGKNGSGTVFFSNCNLRLYLLSKLRNKPAGKWQKNFSRRIGNYFSTATRKRCQ